MTIEFVAKFGLKIPLVVAPMGGGPTTPELVAASCNAGALGSLACAYMEPAEIRDAIERTRRLTAKPFAVNLFTPMPQVHVSQDQLQNALTATRSFRQELLLPDPQLREPYHPDFEKQFAILLEARPAIFSFVFGLLSQVHMQACRAQGILTMGTATTVEEGLQLEEAGVDFITAQGVEGGGHRGLFHAGEPDSEVAILDLVKALTAKTKIPVIAAGGLMTAEDIRRVLQAGAQAAQMGTAFLDCSEAGTSATYRRALQTKKKEGTELTRAFSGRWARGLPNRFMKEFRDKDHAILPFPAQNAFTRDLRKKSAESGTDEFMSLWAGTGVSQIRSGVSATEIIADLVRDF